ncbi:uncharacterized protein G2W53_013850 [Senna tora]|uniref:Uncharacterized protein n=1 Tax=Senna tora TaxID=362788 RepID=A0A834WR22_9FABA|nr:uncharacterized protein G2W53_013850 [Senna tora]
MDSVMAAPRTEESMKTKMPKKNGGGGGFVSRSSSENFEMYGGILRPYPPSLSLCALNHHYRQNQQPPLLPLPIQHPLLSRPPSSTQRNRNRDTSLTPKKSKQAKREEVKRDLKSASRSISEILTVHSASRLGPDPNDLPTKFLLVLTAASGDLETFPGVKAFKVVILLS